MKTFNRTACEHICKELRYLVQKEHRIEQEILGLMKNVFENKWHLELGYSSMYEFLVKDSGMSAGTANRRVQALQLIDQAPIAAQMIREGKLSLSNAAEINRALRVEEKLERKEGIKKEAVKAELREKLSMILKSSQGKSYRECQNILAQALPRQAEQKLVEAKETPTPHGRTQLVVSITSELQAKFDELKSLLSHLDPNPTYEEFLELMANQLLMRLRKNKPTQNTEATNSPFSEKPTHSLRNTPTSEYFETDHSTRANLYAAHVPHPHRRTIWGKAGSRCSFVDKQTQKRCESTHLLEIEHIHPRAQGGTNQLENLTLLCRAHNQLRAWKHGLGNYPRIP